MAAYEITTSWCLKLSQSVTDSNTADLFVCESMAFIFDYMWTSNALSALTVCKLGNRNLKCRQSLKAVLQKSSFRYLEYSPSYGHVYVIGLTLKCAACRLLVWPIYSDLMTSKLSQKKKASA